MVRKTLLSALIILGFTASVAWGAGAEIVAVIDGTTPIPSADILYYYHRQFPEAGPLTKEEVFKRLDMVLGTLLTGDTLRLEAEAKGYGEDAGIKATLAAEEKQFLRAYYGEKIAAAVPISEDEIKAFYEKAKTRRLYSFITVDTKAQADEALAELAAGRSWSKVLDRYSNFKEFPNKERTWPAPMGYIGNPLTEALFALKPGDHTGALEDNFGITWSIYKSVKVVHGDGRSYEEARADITANLRTAKTKQRIEELLAARRDTAPVTRDPEIWEAIKTRPLTEIGETYCGKGVTISSVGGVPVSFDDAFNTVIKAAPIGIPELETLRQERPDRYEAVWDGVTKLLEGDAVLEYEGRAEGILADPAVKREFAARRTDMLIQKFYETDFLSTVPAPTDEEIQQYYEAHKAEYATPERVEVYLAAMPEEKELKAFYKKVKKGADMVITGEARNRTRAEALDAAEELPPPVPPEKNVHLGTVIIYATPQDGESPLATELRPRAFPFHALNEPSEIFRLADGRWAFYVPIYHAEGQQHGLDETEILYFSRKAVFTEKIQASEKEAAAWLDSLRRKHRVTVEVPALDRMATSLVTTAAPGSE